MSVALSDAVVAFAGVLRRQHGFTIGAAQERDALLALEKIGVRDRAHVRAALRCVCCGKADEVAPFDRAFDAFFASLVIGEPQPRPRERGDGPRTAEPAADRRGNATAWETLRARYSPAPGKARAPSLPDDGIERASDDARRLIARLRLGRTRRWRPMAHGRRIDVRRTLRATLHTGGEPIELHALGHPRRDPNFVVLIDGSRSMAREAEGALQFARALCRQTRRARAFVFSTELREVTRGLRERTGGVAPLDDLGEAWGGGTRIGASLKSFLREHGTLLGERTYVMIFSDGLDTGDVPRLRAAMREIARRSAAIAWINPHAGEPAFAPRAAGMKAALPYVTHLVSPQGLRALA